MPARELSLTGLAKEFPPPVAGAPPVLALDRVSLRVAASEIVSIVGPSGCGKSTLLRLVAGFDAPTGGTIRLSGRAVSGPGPDRGMVFQQPTLFPWKSVLDNVAVGPRMRGVPKAECREEAGRYLQAVKLRGFERHFPYQLSGGMRQRVQIARVLINRPDVLLMDEPFGALDFQTRLEMQALLLDLWAQYRPSVLFITHDVDEAIFISDRVYVMSGAPGRIVDEIAVPFGKPRGYATVTASERFAALKIRILERLGYASQPPELAARDGGAAASSGT